MKKAKKKSRVEVVYGGVTFMFVGISKSINAQSHPDPHPRKKIFLSFFLFLSLSFSFFLSLSLSLSYSDYIFSNGSIINKRKPLSRTCRKALK